MVSLLLQILRISSVRATMAVAMFATAFAGAVSVSADDWIDNPQPVESAELSASSTTSSFAAQPSVSAAEAAASVRQQHGGRVLSVSPSRRGDSLGYRVRVLVEGGRVKTVYVRSGQVGSAPSRSPSRSSVRPIGDG